MNDYIVRHSLHYKMYINQSLESEIGGSKQQTIIILPNYRLVQYKDAIYYGGLDQKQKPSGSGILIHDDGDILISQFRDGVPEGKYFYFRSKGTGMCFYGSCLKRKLEGINYAFSRKKAIVKAEFRQGRPAQDEFNLKNKYHTYLVNNRVNGKPSRHSSDHDQQFILPTDFLNRYFGKPNHFETQQGCFRTFQIEEDQTFFGVVEKGKPGGCGVIFINQWPVCYGMFKNGKLNGQARVEQSPLMLIDGLFQQSLMTMGWVINYKQTTLGFGKRQKDRKVFQLSEQFNAIDVKLIETFKKQNHMKSVFYKNSYAPYFCPKTMWPQTYLQQIAYEEVINDIINNFNPSHISDISRVPEDSSHRFQRDLVDLMAEHRSQVDSHNRVTKILESRLKQYDEKHSKSKSGSRQKLIFSSKSKQRIASIRSKEKLNIKSNKNVKNNKVQQNGKNSYSNLNLDRIYSKYLRKN